jgi:hypothetical protein
VCGRRWSTVGYRGPVFGRWRKQTAAPWVRPVPGPGRPPVDPVEREQDLAEVAPMTSDIAETLAAIKRANAVEDLEEIARLKAEFKERSAQRNRAAAASPTAGRAPEDPRLEWLADLHDRGVLTDAQYASEKARLLEGE